MGLTSIFRHQQVLMENKKQYQQMLNAFPFDMYAKPDEIRKKFEEELTWARSVLGRSDRVVWWLKVFMMYYVVHSRHMLNLFKGDDPNDPNYQSMERKVEQQTEYLNRSKFIRAFRQENPDIEKYLTDMSPEFSALHIGGYSIDNYKSSFEHYFSLNIPAINDLPFRNQSPLKIRNTFIQMEREYIHDQRKNKVRKLNPNSDHTVILEMGNFVWLNLNKASCEEEGNAGGHCGNSPRSDTR